MKKARFPLAQVLPTLVATLLLCGAARAEKDVHLFILSGQSNMGGLKPSLSFTPTVTKALAPDEVLVIKDALGGQPIRRWYSKWQPAKGRPVAQGKKPRPHGDLYERLMGKVKPVIDGKKPTTITFVWMQGERDAKEMHGEVYAQALTGLIAQLRRDLGRPDMTAVIGRLSDFNVGNESNHWDMVREAQVQVAKADPRVAWIDTDDLNGEKDGLHYDEPGYLKLGKRFAEASLKLLDEK